MPSVLQKSIQEAVKHCSVHVRFSAIFSMRGRPRAVIVYQPCLSIAKGYMYPLLQPSFACIFQTSLETMQPWTSNATLLALWASKVSSEFHIFLVAFE